MWSELSYGDKRVDLGEKVTPPKSKALGGRQKMNIRRLLNKW
jgi:hypothetical protein